MDYKFQELHYILIYYMCWLFLTKSNFIDILKFIESVFKACSDENYCGVTIEAITTLFLLPTVLAIYILEAFWESVLPKTRMVLRKQLANKN